MKKIISTITALVFAFAFCTTAFAEETTVAETTATVTTAVETTAAVTTAAVTTLPAETTVSETALAEETTEAEAVLLDEPVVAEETVLDNDMTLYKGYTPPENVNEELMYASGMPQTGSAAGGIAVFATLSIAAAAVFVCRKRKA